MRAIALSPAERAAMPKLILAALKKKQGQTIAELSQRFDLSREQVRSLTAALRASGKLVLLRCGHGNTSHWFTAAEGAIARKESELAAAKKRKERNKAWSRLKWSRTKAARGNEPDEPEGAEVPPQRWVDPHAPLPFVCRAPASVFQWRPEA